MIGLARTIVSVGLMIGTGALAVAVSGHVRAQSSAMDVTTDTPQYCLQLLDQVSDLVHIARAPPSPDVTELSSEGRRMCDHGQTRSGIMRLRRALVLMKQDDEPPTR